MRNLLQRWLAERVDAENEVAAHPELYGSERWDIQKRKKK